MGSSCGKRIRWLRFSWFNRLFGFRIVFPIKPERGYHMEIERKQFWINCWTVSTKLSFIGLKEQENNKTSNRSQLGESFQLRTIAGTANELISKQKREKVEGSEKDGKEKGEQAKFEQGGLVPFRINKAIKQTITLAGRGYFEVVIVSLLRASKRWKRSLCLQWSVYQSAFGKKVPSRLKRHWRQTSLNCIRSWREIRRRMGNLYIRSTWVIGY